jgi:hypothetical protein
VEDSLEHPRNTAFQGHERPTTTEVGLFPTDDGLFPTDDGTPPGIRYGYGATLEGYGNEGASMYEIRTASPPAQLPAADQAALARQALQRRRTKSPYITVEPVVFRALGQDYVAREGFLITLHNRLFGGIRDLFDSLAAATAALGKVGTAIDGVMDVFNSLKQLQGFDNTLSAEHITDLVEFIGKFDIRAQWASVDKLWSRFSKNVRAMASGIQQWAIFPGFGGIP